VLGGVEDERRDRWTHPDDVVLKAVKPTQLPSLIADRQITDADTLIALSFAPAAMASRTMRPAG
jgi:hypothetical protein